MSWIFDKRGFVSTVAYDPKKDPSKKKKAAKAGTHVLVRARIKEDLDWIKAVVPSMVAETDSSADYAYRAVISRRAFKKVLVNHADGITYDSHFKEAARDNSPKAEGRYTAMMSVWTAMSKLQPIAPWSGASWGGGYTPGKSSSTDLWSGDDWKPSTNSSAVEDLANYRKGNGPMTGYEVDDRVVCYNGAGKVVEVSPSAKVGGADIVRVLLDGGTAPTIYLSNYLSPEEIKDEVLGDEDFDLTSVYDFLKKVTAPGSTASATDYPVEKMEHLDDDAFELLTRVQEIVESGEDLSQVIVDEHYDEILWETSSDTERLRIFADAATVPAKYEADAIKLFTGDLTSVN